MEVVRRCNAAFNRRDRDAAFDDYHPNLEWRDLQHAPDTPERIEGIAELLAVWEDWENAFEDFTAEIEECIDAGKFVVTLTHWRAKGKGSALTVDQRSAEVWEFANGKIARATVGYANLGAALKAVGRER